MLVNSCTLIHARIQTCLTNDHDDVMMITEKYTRKIYTRQNKKTLDALNYMFKEMCTLPNTVK